MTDRLSLPATYTTGQIIDAAHANTYWKDNLTSIDGGYGCQVATATSQTLATGTAAALAFDAENFDDDTMHDNSTNPSRITVPNAGRYLVLGWATFAANSTGSREISLRVNGSLTNAANAITNSATLTTYLTIMDIVTFTAGQYVELWGWQNSGGDLAVTNRKLSVTKFI